MALLIVDIPLAAFPPPAQPRQPCNIPALPLGELEALSGISIPGTQNLILESESEDDTSGGCTYEGCDGRQCGRPRIHYTDEEEPEEYCAAHYSWIEHVESELEVPYPDSRQALLDLLAHTAGQVLAGEMRASRAMAIMHLARAIERQLRWL